MQTDALTPTTSRSHSLPVALGQSGASLEGAPADSTAKQIVQRTRRGKLTEREGAERLYTWLRSHDVGPATGVQEADAIGRDLLSDIDLQTVISKIIRCARDLTGRENVAVCLSDDAQVHQGRATVYHAPNANADADQPIVTSRIASAGLPDGKKAVVRCSACAGCPLQANSGQCVTLALRDSRDTPLGALCVVDDGHGTKLMPHQLRELMAFSGWAAIALNNAMRLADAESKARASRAQMVAHLHDNAAQSISLLALKVDQLVNQLEKEELASAADQVGLIRSLVHKVGAQVREVLSDSVEPQRLAQDFLPELRACADAFSRFTEIPVELLVLDDCYPAASAQAQVLHIVGEALANIRRHAQATRVRIEIRRCAGDIQIEVCDDGKGFATGVTGGPHHLGVTIMKERARRCGGQLTIESAPGSGTCVRLQLPAAA